MSLGGGHPARLRGAADLLPFIIHHSAFIIAIMMAPMKRESSIAGPLVDGFGRVHNSLRISVTDRCNIRCFYCMPAENVRFKPRSELLTFEEITRFVKVVARLGIDKIRLTGGEPLVRSELH